MTRPGQNSPVVTTSGGQHGRMGRFFTADLHLGHRNIARYETGRAEAGGVAPLEGSANDETQSRLDSFLIDRWNEVVGPDDEVWLLGDVCMGRDEIVDGTTSLALADGTVVDVQSNAWSRSFADPEPEGQLAGIARLSWARR